MSMVTGENGRNALSDEALLATPFGSVALQLRNRRRGLGLSVRKLAASSGVGVRTLYDYERGEHRPNLATIAPHLLFSEEEVASMLEQMPEVEDKRRRPLPVLAVKANLFDEVLATALKDIVEVEGSSIPDLVLEGLGRVVEARRSDPEFLQNLEEHNAALLQASSERTARWETPET